MTKPNFEMTSCAVDQHKFTVFGTWINTSLPRDLPLYFRDGVFINRDNNKPMEQDAYSIFLALKSLETVYGIDYRKERRAIVDAVLKRMRDCGGFWIHGEWTGSEKEIHMRYSAAAIRLLTEALNEGLLTSSGTIVDALRRHLSFSEPLNCGTWFLHDSLEQDRCGVKLPGWAKPMPNKVWGSSHANCLVLNTHVDTLVTIIDVLRRVELNETDRKYFLSILQSGAMALKIALRSNQSIVWRYFAGFDSAVRSTFFWTYSHQSLAAKILRQALWIIFARVYVPVRQWVRSREPGYVFPHGYLERDISLRGSSFVYHLVNVHDLVKFVIQAKESGLVIDNELLDRCDELVDQGIDYAIQSNYWHWLVASMKRRGEAIQLCEAILARLSTMPWAQVPAHWLLAYCAIRRTLSPTAAIFGFDPFIVKDAEPRSFPMKGWDFIRLRNGKKLAIDFAHENIKFEDHSP